MTSPTNDAPLTDEEHNALLVGEDDRARSVTAPVCILTFAEARALLRLRAGTHVVVPREATDEILFALGLTDLDAARELYRAMLLAAAEEEI